MKMLEGYKVKNKWHRKNLIGKLVRNCQVPVVTCMRCNVGKHLQTADIPLCFGCLNHLNKPLDAKSYARTIYRST